MWSRRQVLALCAASTAAGLPFGDFLKTASATPRDARNRLDELTGGFKPNKGRVRIVLPDVTDQGDYVPMRVAVHSPMSEDDYVQAIHIVAERNPTPAVASFYLSPANGRAEVSTRIRLSKTQVVIVAAQMSNGTVYLEKARCKITTGAGGCG